MLRNRLSIIILYLDIFITLNLNTLKIIKKDTNFENCRLIKISINYLEINQYIIFLEKNQIEFENFRYFFSTISNAQTTFYNIFKIFFYFDNKNIFRKFI